MSHANNKNSKCDKILIVSSHSSRSFNLVFTKPVKAIFTSFFIFLFVFLSVIGCKYWFYHSRVTSFHDRFQTIMNSDDKDLTREIKVKKALIKTEAFINTSDLFLSKAAVTEKDACNVLKLPYSNEEFSDFLFSIRSSKSKAQPATVITDTYPVIGDHQDQLETSLQRQEAIQENVRKTPTGLPVNGYPIRKGKYISTPGIEILAPYGTYVKATAGGEITNIEEISSSMYLIEITHKNEDLHTTISRYLFCYDLLVQEGDEVEKGQVIAKVGVYPGTNESLIGYQLLVNNLAVEP